MLICNCGVLSRLAKNHSSTQTHFRVEGRRKREGFLHNTPKVISIVFVELDCKTIHASPRPSPPSFFDAAIVHSAYPPLPYSKSTSLTASPLVYIDPPRRCHRPTEYQDTTQYARVPPSFASPLTSASQRPPPPLQTTVLYPSKVGSKSTTAAQRLNSSN